MADNITTDKTDLESELKDARRDIETLAMMAAERAGEAGSHAAEIAERKVHELSDEARRFYDDARKSGIRARNQAEEQMRENPLAFAGIAFLLGAVFAALMGGRR